MNLRQLARSLGGEVCSSAVLCPGPGHFPIDRSLSVRLAPDAPNGLVVHSFAGDDWKLCKSYVLKRLGLSSSPRLDIQRNHATAGNRREQVLRLWREAGDPHGTPGGSGASPAASRIAVAAVSPPLPASRSGRREMLRAGDDLRHARR
jgi:hypothetical protein